MLPPFMNGLDSSACVCEFTGNTSWSHSEAQGSINSLFSVTRDMQGNSMGTTHVETSVSLQVLRSPAARLIRPSLRCRSQRGPESASQP